MSEQCQKLQISHQNVWKDATVVALVSLVLTFPFIGIFTQYELGVLMVETRWHQNLWIVGIIFLGRLCINYGTALYRYHCSPTTKTKKSDSWSRKLFAKTDVQQKFWRVFWALLIVLPVLLQGQREWIDIVSLMMLYLILGWGLSVIVGLAGLLDLGFVAYYAIGAYTYAILFQFFDFSFWISFPIAMVVSAGFATLLGYPVLRLRGDYFAIVTLAFGEIVRLVLLNWSSLTQGSAGIQGMPKPTFFGLEFNRTASGDMPNFFEFFGFEYHSAGKIIFFYYVTLMFLVLVFLWVHRIRQLPIGRAWEAIREDEIASQSLGIHLTKTKLSAYRMGAMIAGLAGTLFAARQGLVTPGSFTFMESAMVLAIVVLGGMGNMMGVVWATLLLVGVPEIFREFGEYRMLLFGLVMVLVMVWRPGGLSSKRQPTLLLKPTAVTKDFVGS